MSDKATARPWKQDRDGIRDAHGRLLGAMDGSIAEGIDGHEDCANARLIVKAVNHFEEMREVILNLVICPAFTGAVFERDKESHRAWTLARAILAKLEEE